MNPIKVGDIYLIEYEHDSTFHSRLSRLNDSNLNFGMEQYKTELDRLTIPNCNRNSELDAGKVKQVYKVSFYK